MGFDQNPLRIADVAGIGLCSHVALYAFPPPYGTGSKPIRTMIIALLQWKLGLPRPSVEKERKENGELK